MKKTPKEIMKGIEEQLNKIMLREEEIIKRIRSLLKEARLVLKKAHEKHVHGKECRDSHNEECKYKKKHKYD